MKKKDLTFDESVARIEEIVKSIESGEPDIDKLSETVREASALIRQCRDKLRETEAKINDIIKDNNE